MSFIYSSEGDFLCLGNFTTVGTEARERMLGKNVPVHNIQRVISVRLLCTHTYHSGTENLLITNRLGRFSCIFFFFLPGHHVVSSPERCSHKKGTCPNGVYLLHTRLIPLRTLACNMKGNSFPLFLLCIC